MTTDLKPDLVLERNYELIDAIQRSCVELSRRASQLRLCPNRAFEPPGPSSRRLQEVSGVREILFQGPRIEDDHIVAALDEVTVHQRIERRETSRPLRTDP
jgi:hypothetical protein